ncbi:hypothetical protein JX265_009175 [Neoarthrinium moseri]|uniref:Uncharacterized protein n=1 Tax=Neoarthrinium moseri TaxID=1658444 RepID=A0A9P9WGK1_9PEZI|nr:uncharacterized protein JN550_011784 [Neoarthrinium moseri]KAI1847746.1 hypothetical protein JX266_006241 [Neoarthrinium moseri]KAI1859973.1 hypothetical protein JN550_011784 [Neoarthrinium moseri]KAI1862461.1 hypothetical protein JX265_009175 [Neoarthrinium moseri]
MASELAPRLLLAATIRIVLVFFGIFALVNAGSYIGPFRDFSGVYAATVAAWITVTWNIIAVSAAAVHPYLQRFADRLPFPIKVTVRGKTILSYGDSDENGDGLMAPLVGKISLAVIDIILASLLLAFMLMSRDYTLECDHLGCLGRDLRVQKWILNSWLTVVIFEYALAVVQLFEAFGLWYNRRYMSKRGHISLA